TGALLHTWNSLCRDSTSMIEPSTCSESGSAIWGRTGAVIDTITGDIYVATGNGRWDGKTFWGDATIRLDSTATKMLGNYTPSNTQELDESDTDVGSTSPALLGGGFIAQGGKDGTIKLLDTTLMQGTAPHRWSPADCSTCTTRAAACACTIRPPASSSPRSRATRATGTRPSSSTAGSRCRKATRTTMRRPAIWTSGSGEREAAPPPLPRHLSTSSPTSTRPPALPSS